MTTPVHPVCGCVTEVREQLAKVADVNPVFLTTAEKAAVLVELAAVEAQLAELRLRVIAAAEDVTVDSAARDLADWLQARTRGRIEDLRADQRLAVALDRDYARLAEAMRAGECTLSQAHVIARALDEIPKRLGAEIRARAETALVEHATRFTPAQLRRLGRRILEVVAPEIADAEEARRLAAQEAHARRKTRLTTRRLGDGTTRVSAVVPDATADRLHTNLEAFASPRRDDGTRTETGEHLPYERRLGRAFCSLLEAVDPQRLPIHGGDATTLIITIDLASLYQELGVGETITGTSLSAGEIRRLACNANLVPAVLGTGSEVLDLGRIARLFTAAQRRALLLRSPTCEAEGCTIPGTWSEAHHWLAWADGGKTDLANASLLCSHHHHRAHDPAYAHERLANGDIRFTLRR